MDASEVVIDALPYYDKDIDLDSELRPKVTASLGAELRSLLAESKNELHPRLPGAKERPLPPSSTLLGKELARVQGKKKLKKNEGLDAKRYTLPVPTGAKASVDDWKAAYDNSLAQLEHQRLRTLNGQLLSQMGPNAWRIQNFTLENYLERLDSELAATRDEVEQVNRIRKNKQEEAGKILSRMDARWRELISSTLQLEIGTIVLESEVAQLHEQHAELKKRLEAMS